MINDIAIDNLSLTLPLTRSARETATQFAQQQVLPDRAEQVRLNTLAVWVVNDYLQMMGIPTNLAKSGSWNSDVKAFTDAADLEITEVGKLECRPIRAHEHMCHVPPEVWEGRIGYVIVQIDEFQKAATLLGFVQTIKAEEFAIAQLQQPIEDVCDRIDLLRSLNRSIVNLHQWLENIYDQDWQEPEPLLKKSQVSLVRFRSRSHPGAISPEPDNPDSPDNNAIVRGKLIDLGIQVAGLPVALVVEMQPEVNQDVLILVQIYPTGGHDFLPSKLELIILDGSGEEFAKVLARNVDNLIQYQFWGEVGERFSVQLVYRGSRVTENFRI